jgi:hypothetical protein
MNTITTPIWGPHVTWRGSRAPKELKAVQHYTLRVEARNEGDTLWLSDTNPVGGHVTLGARLYNAKNEALDLDYGRGHLAGDVHPREKQVADIPLVVPQGPRVYYVELDMVCEMICRFGQRGSETIRERIHVV